MKERLVQVYKSTRKTEMYLYVDKARGLADVPEPLMKQFGESEEVMMLMLSPGRKLARADAAEVLREIDENGFYLQMPPTMDELMRREGVS